jgi:hypothetical protein
MYETSGTGNPESRTWDNIRFYGSLGKPGLSERIKSLDGEWDAEKFTVVALSGASLFGLAMGIFGSRLWRLLAWSSLPLLFLHGQGKWKPSDGLIRSLGLRTRREIHQEKYALKAMRGDFRGVEIPSGEEGESLARNSSRALEAVNA